MRKFKQKWTEMPRSDKTVYIVELLIAMTIIVFGLILLLGIGDGEPDFSMLMMPTAMLLFAFQRRKEHRGLAIFELCAAVFISLVILIRFVL